MPQGKGTYGSQVGRPPTDPKTKKPKKSTVSAHGQLGDAQKEYETDKKLHKNKSLGKGGYVKKKKTYPKSYTKKDVEFLKKQREDVVRYEDLDEKGKKIWKSQGKKVPSPNKMGVGYTPFKMKAADYGNSPMKKNYGEFGVGHPEAPEKPTPNKFFGGIATPWGAVKKIRDKIKAKKAARDAAGAAPEDNAAEAAAENAEVAGGAPTPEGRAGGAFAQIKKHMAGKEGGNEELEERISTIESLPNIQPNLRTAKKKGMGPFAQMKFDQANKRADRKAAFDEKFGWNKAASRAVSSTAMFSDIRLKEKIQKTGSSPSGIPIYEFNYIGDSNRYRGAMAQDLLDINPGAVEMDSSGYYKVNYNDIDVDMHQINN